MENKLFEIRDAATFADAKEAAAMIETAGKESALEFIATIREPLEPLEVRLVEMCFMAGFTCGVQWTLRRNKS